MGFFDSLKNGINSGFNSTGADKKLNADTYVVICPRCHNEIRVYADYGEIKCPDCGKIISYYS